MVANETGVSDGECYCHFDLKSPRRRVPEHTCEELFKLDKPLPWPVFERVS